MNESCGSDAPSLCNDRIAGVSIGKFNESDLDDFLNLSKMEFSKLNSKNQKHEDWKNLYVESLLTNPNYIGWKHMCSPFGESTIVRLKVDNCTVGRVLLQPRPLYSLSQKFNVASYMDMLVARDYRSPPSNFINLIKASDAMPDFDFVYHTANEVTHQLYERLLLFPKPFSLKSYGLPLRIAGLLSEKMGRRLDALDWLTAPFRWLMEIVAIPVYWLAMTKISKLPMSDTELEDLFTTCLRQSGPLLARTSAYLKWRFGKSSGFPVSIYRIDNKKCLIGYFVVRHQALGGLKHLVLEDFLLDSSVSLYARIALRLWLIRLAIISKADTFFTMINSGNNMARKCVGLPFIRIPDKLLPHPTPIFIRSYGKNNKYFETDKSMHLTLADLDLY